MELEPGRVIAGYRLLRRVSRASEHVAEGVAEPAAQEWLAAVDGDTEAEPVVLALHVDPRAAYVDAAGEDAIDVATEAGLTIVVRRYRPARAGSGAGLALAGAGAEVRVAAAARGPLVRPRLAIPLGGGVLLLAVVAVIVSLPSGSSSAAPAPVPSATASTGVPPVVPSDEPGDAPSGEPAQPRESAPPVATAPTSTPPADDLAAMAVALLRARDACVAQGSAACLADVDEVASQALRADTSVALAVAGGQTATAFDPLGAVLVERLGDGAIVTASLVDGEELPLLLMRSADGWRIRTYLPAAGG